jgi:flagellar assembly protein FliH
MIIKRRQLDKLQNPATGNPAELDLDHFFPEAEGTFDSAWDEIPFESAEERERRLDERRRSYRRVEDKTLITKAHEEANAIRENAQQEGFEEGLRQAEQLIIELRETLQSLLNAREEALLSVADEIAGLAVEVAEKVIKTEVSCDDSLVMALVRDTIQKPGRNVKSLLIKVHPDDVRLVKKSLADNPLPNVNAELIVMEDPTVDLGSCIVETNGGMIDASFSTQLQLLKRLFGVGGSG